MKMGFTLTLNAKDKRLLTGQKNAISAIDLVLGKGHSSFPEATLSVLTQVRAKDTN